MDAWRVARRPKARVRVHKLESRTALACGVVPVALPARDDTSFYWARVTCGRCLRTRTVEIPADPGQARAAQLTAAIQRSRRVAGAIGAIRAVEPGYGLRALSLGELLAVGWRVGVEVQRRADARDDGRLFPGRAATYAHIRAGLGETWERFTLAHELAHHVLHGRMEHRAARRGAALRRVVDPARLEAEAHTVAWQAVRPSLAVRRVLPVVVAAEYEGPGDRTVRVVVMAAFGGGADVVRWPRFDEGAGQEATRADPGRPRIAAAG